MKNIFLASFCFFSAILTQAQINPESDSDGCSQKCSRANAGQMQQRISYYQYPSMDKYDLHYLKLDLSAEPGSRFISGTAGWKARAKEPMDSFIMEFKNNMVLDSVYINGVKKTFQRGSDHVFIPLSPTVSAGSELDLTFYYQGTANSNGVFSGSQSSSGLTYTATLSESYQAREWFPAKQFLGDKIDSADIWITTTLPNKAGSNGLLVAQVPKPGNKMQYQWKTRYPMNYYLPHFSVGNYMEYLNYAKPAAIAPDSILIQNYISDNPTYFNSVKTNIDKTPPFIELYSEQFGLYPFHEEKYGHVHAGIGGGMEHQTMSTMNSFGSTLIAHELGHQWWGDQVTCASWNHIWLNEGFASYCEYLAIESLPSLFTTTAATYMNNVHNNVMSVNTGSVYVPDADLYNEGRIFSGRLSYNKGSAIVHTLRFIMQDDNLFFQALRNFQQQYKDSVATATDFKQVVETTSGKNLDDYFNQWYYGEGFPTFNITYLMQGVDSIVLVVNQTTSSPAVTPFFKGLYELSITSTQGDTTVLINLEQNNQVFKIPYQKTPNGIVVDPNNWVINRTGTIVFGGVIPVRVNNWKAEGLTDCSFKLQWTAENQGTTENYIIEYRADSNQFVQVGEVLPVAGATASYQFTYQPNQSGTAYFRLLSVDRFGLRTYSPVISVEDPCRPQTAVNIRPNPAIDHAEILLNIPVAGNTQWRLVNSAGQVVYKERRALPAGRNTVTLPLQNLAAGMYTLDIILPDQNRYIEKLIKK